MLNQVKLEGIVTNVFDSENGDHEITLICKDDKIGDITFVVRVEKGTAKSSLFSHLDGMLIFVFGHLEYLVNSELVIIADKLLVE